MPVAFSATVVTAPPLAEGDARLDAVAAALRNATLASTVYSTVSARRVRAVPVVAASGFIRNCSDASVAAYRARLGSAMSLSATDVTVLCVEQAALQSATSVPRPPTCSALAAALVLDTTLRLAPAANASAVQERFAALPGSDGGLRGLCVPGPALMPAASASLDFVLAMPDPTVLYGAAAAAALAAAGNGTGGAAADAAAVLAAVAELLAADVRLAVAVGLAVPLQQVELVPGSLQMHLPPSPPPAPPRLPVAPPPVVLAADGTGTGGGATPGVIVRDGTTVGSFRRDRQWSIPIIISLSCTAGLVVLLLIFAYIRSRRRRHDPPGRAKNAKGAKGTSVQFDHVVAGAGGLAPLAPGTAPIGPKTEELHRNMSLAPPAAALALAGAAAVAGGGGGGGRDAAGGAGDAAAAAAASSLQGSGAPPSAAAAAAAMSFLRKGKGPQGPQQQELRKWAALRRLMDENKLAATVTPAPAGGRSPHPSTDGGQPPPPPLHRAASARAEVDPIAADPDSGHHGEDASPAADGYYLRRRAATAVGVLSAEAPVAADPADAAAIAADSGAISPFSSALHSTGDAGWDDARPNSGPVNADRGSGSAGGGAGLLARVLSLPWNRSSTPDRSSAPAPGGGKRHTISSIPAEGDAGGLGRSRSDMRSPGSSRGRGPSRLASPLGSGRRSIAAVHPSGGGVGGDGDSPDGTASRSTPTGRTSRASRSALMTLTGPDPLDGMLGSDGANGSGGEGGGHGSDADAAGGAGGVGRKGSLPDRGSHGALDHLLDNPHAKSFASQASMSRRLDSYQSVMQDENGRPVIVYERRRPPRDLRHSELGAALSHAASPALSPHGSFLMPMDTPSGGGASEALPLPPALIRVAPPLLDDPLDAPHDGRVSQSQPHRSMRRVLSEEAMEVVGEEEPQQGALRPSVGTLAAVPPTLEFGGDGDIRVEAAPRSYVSLLATAPSLHASDGRPRSGASSRAPSRTASVSSAIGRAVGRRRSQVLAVDGPPGAAAAAGVPISGGPPATDVGPMFEDDDHRRPCTSMAPARPPAAATGRARSVTISGFPSSPHLAARAAAAAAAAGGGVGKGRAGWSPLSRESVSNIGPQEGGDVAGSAADSDGAACPQRWKPKRTKSYSRLAHSSQAGDTGGPFPAPAAHQQAGAPAPIATRTLQSLAGVGPGPAANGSTAPGAMAQQQQQPAGLNSAAHPRPNAGKAAARHGRGRVGWGSATGDGDGGAAPRAVSGPAAAVAAAALAASSDDEAAHPAPLTQRPPSRWAAMVSVAPSPSSAAAGSAARPAVAATATTPGTEPPSDADGGHDGGGGKAGPRVWGRSLTLKSGRTFGLGSLDGRGPADAADSGTNDESPPAVRTWRRELTLAREGAEKGQTGSGGS